MNSNQTVTIGSVVIVLAILGLGAFAYFAPSLDTAKQKADVKFLVTDFGAKLKNVPLSGTEDGAREAIQQNYASFVAPDLLQQWLANPRLAPGRLTSSPWPERIEVISVTPQGEGYVVTGNVILLTSVEMATGSGSAGMIPVVVQVIPAGDAWQVVAYQEQSIK